MKIIIDKKDLLYVTTMVNRAASSKNTIPILSGILLEADTEKGLTMTATDMDIGIIVNTTNVEVIESGRVLVNAGYFSDFIKTLPESSIKLELCPDSSRLSINYGRSSGFINIYRDFEYPDLPVDKMQDKLSISQSLLKQALRKTSFAAAVNHFRQVFTGVLFDIVENGGLNIVASDTHRLAFYNCQLDLNPVPDPFNFIIPLRTVNELLRMLDDSDELINIAFSDNQVLFYKEKHVLLSRLIEGSYPNYDTVIPSSSNCVISINSQSLLNSLERARTMPTDDKLKIQHVQIKLNNNELVINSYSEIMGEIEEVIEDIEVEGENDIKIAFNTNYFLDIAKLLNSESERLKVSLSGSLGPALIKNPDNDNYLYVLVPLRTSN